MRLPDWDARLIRFLALNRGRAFRWGSWDCCLFACNAVREMTGVDLAAPFRGRYHTMLGAMRFTGGSVLNLVNEVARKHKLDAYENPAEARAGDVVMADVTEMCTLGILSPIRLAVFATSSGLSDYPRRIVKHAWKVG